MTSPNKNPIGITELTDCVPQVHQVIFNKREIDSIQSDLFPKLIALGEVGTALACKGRTTIEPRERSEFCDPCTVVQGAELLNSEVPTAVEIIIPEKPSGVGLLDRIKARIKGELPEPVWDSAVTVFTRRG